MHLAKLSRVRILMLTTLACANASSAQQTRFAQLNLDDTTGNQRALA